ncbi:transcriptional regulator [Burkholderia multivorans]|uniref:transcriptional regulator n=1 Tax=Burkholderia multivorans TaxID=87883 RepID=UPI0021599CDA|nr:transcriptional regulator [Burkholderia multivorans]
MQNDNVLTAEARATIMDACQSISRSADALKECHTVDGDWGDDVDAKAFYDAELRLLERLTALLAPTKQPSGEVTEKQPSLTNPLTPYGMLVRGLRIVSGTTLMDMAKALLTTPAKLSAMEFGRAPVTPEFAFDVAAYFDALGVPCTESALRAAARAQGGES